MLHASVPLPEHSRFFSFYVFNLLVQVQCDCHEKFFKKEKDSCTFLLHQLWAHIYAEHHVGKQEAYQKNPEGLSLALVTGHIFYCC